MALEMADAGPTLYEQRYKAAREKFQEYLPVTLALQSQLREDAALLSAQEGWDLATQAGVAAWIDDIDSIYGFLRRNNYNQDKAYPIILSALPNRVQQSLHLPIPSIPPYSVSPFFYILPPNLYTDRVGRPIAVITPRFICRDANGKLDDITQWLWWVSEMLRRTLYDYWRRGKWGGPQGHGGEGCVAIIDAGGTGYRNMEVELFPALGKIGAKNFPGAVQAAYIVNAGWTQRSLWKMVKPVLPKTAIDRIVFIDEPCQLEEFFDLDRVPTQYGGNGSFDFELKNPVLEYYSAHSIGTAPPLDSKGISRATSFSSVADVFHSAQNSPQNTPFLSRRPSINDESLRMTAQQPVRPPVPYPHSSPKANSPLEEEFSQTIVDKHLKVETSASLTPLQRIQSLVDFKLYLSPSRLAQVDQLLDLDDDREPREPPPHKELRPAIVEHKMSSVKAILDAQTPQRSLPYSYSQSLLRHHAQGLIKLDGTAITEIPTKENVQVAPQETQSQMAATPSQQEDPGDEPKVQAISAFSRSSNPFYGYPVVRVQSPHHPGQTYIQPAHERRWRDLIKTLLFLFLLRLQTLRSSFERKLGLNRLIPWVGGPGQVWTKARNPTEGLQRTAGGGKVVVRRNWESDWAWMIVGILLVRGTCGRLLTIPLEIINARDWRRVLGVDSVSAQALSLGRG